jgi:serine/threonine-protein kinase
VSNICPKCGGEYSSTDTFCPEDGSRLAASTGEHPATADLVTVAGGDDPLLGRVVDGRYELTKLLGVGGMGRVYLAQHRFLERHVAVKVLHRGRVNDPSELVRFNRTAVHAGTILDDHVAQVYDFGETDDGLVYLAMEYVPGETLTRMVKTEGPFALARVAELARQIAKGLDAAHAKGIIHRDLKPDNIMVMRDRNGREMVKIVDFGIAKALGNDSRGVTELGAVVGTLMFMSPEQLAGSTLDRRSDLYSLTLVVFQMLTGALPFGGDTPEQVIYGRFGDSNARPLATVRPTVAWPAGLQPVIDRALARDSAARYDTAGEFAAAFDAAVGTPSTPPTDTRPPRKDAKDALERTRRAGAIWWRQHNRHVARVASVGTVAVLITAAGAELIDRWREIQSRPTGDSLALRIATGEAGVERNLAEKAKAQTTQTQTNAKDTKPNDTGRSTERTEVAPPITPAVAEARHDAALRELEQLRNRLHPDSTVSEYNARAAIGRLDALMPQLRDRTDSLFALLYKSHAYYHLGELDDQCAVLRRIRSRASGSRLEAVVEGYFGYGKC